MSKICRNCNSLLLDTACFCNNCGARVTDTVFDSDTMKKCEHCGAVLPKSARFCTNCGLPVGVPEAQGYAGRCERCGTWLKPNAQFCTNCGRRVAVQTYNFTQQPAAPVQAAAAVVPAVTQPPTNETVYAPIAEEPPQPKVLPPLNSRPTRKNDYDDNMSIDMSFDLPPADMIVTPEPDVVEGDVVPQNAPAAAEDIVDIEPTEAVPVQTEPAPADETEVLSGEIV